MTGKVPSFFVGGRTGLSVQQVGDVQHSPPYSSSSGGEKTGVRGAVFSADLQVAAWPSCQRPARFLGTLKAQGLRTVFGAFSALGMINGAAPLTAP